MTNGTNNQTGWSNPDYDRLIAEASQTGDQAARYAAFQKAEAILLEDAPILPVYFYTHAFLIRPSVKGWYPTILTITLTNTCGWNDEIRMANDEETTKIKA